MNICWTELQITPCGRERVGSQAACSVRVGWVIWQAQRRNERWNWPRCAHCGQGSYFWPHHLFSAFSLQKSLPLPVYLCRCSPWAHVLLAQHAHYKFIKSMMYGHGCVCRWRSVCMCLSVCAPASRGQGCYIPQTLAFWDRVSPWLIALQVD